MKWEFSFLALHRLYLTVYWRLISNFGPLLTEKIFTKKMQDLILDEGSMILMHNFQQKKELLCAKRCTAIFRQTGMFFCFHICTLVELVLFCKDPDFVVFISLLKEIMCIKPMVGIREKPRTRGNPIYGLNHCCSVTNTHIYLK